MTGDSEKHRLLEFLGRDRRVLVGLTLAYLVVGLLCIVTDYTLNDEGLVTFTAADFARYFPLEILFVQKAKPVVTLMYTWFAGLGVHGLQCVHLVVCAMAVPMSAAVARALGFSMPNLVALTVAASPGFLLAGPAALSNADGVLGVTAVLYLLLARRNDLAAGLVLGTLPWVRHELALFAAVLVVRAVVTERNLRFVAGAAAFPLIYGFLGGLFHHDMIWLVNYPPSTLYSMPGNPIWADFSASALLRGLFGLSTLFPFLLCAPSKRFHSIERWLLVYALAWITIASILPAWHIANFGFVPRYMMVLVPIIALAIGRAVEAYAEGEAKLAVAFIAVATTAVLWTWSGFKDWHAVLPVLVLLTTGLVLAALGRGRTAAGALTLLVALGPALGVRTEIPRTELAAYLPQVAEWMRANPDRTKEVVYTNIPLLAAYLDGAAKLPGLDVRFLIGVDQAYDMEHMMSSASGQLGKLEALMAAGRFNGGRGVLPQNLSPETVPNGSIFVFRHDRRLELLMLPDVWDSYLTDVYDEDFRVATFAR